MTATDTTIEPAAGRVRPKLAVWKFASCDGCQLSLLDCEDELLAVAGAIDIAFFPEATSTMVEGPYDVSLVEGSVTTPHDLERIHQIREQSGLLVTIGACATAGGIQSLRNGADIDEFVRTVYAHPEFISTLATSTPIGDHVQVDAELRGCPIDRGQLIEIVSSLVNGRPARLPTTSVCNECKARGTTCVLVAEDKACLGPVTQAGCGALCPSYARGCFGCFGPMESPNVEALTTFLIGRGHDRDEMIRLLRGFSGWSEPFREVSVRLGVSESKREVVR